MFDKAYGCVLGAFVGDAAGAPLEFYTGEINETVVRKAMSMPGGGSLNIGEGQITDDSELAMCLIHSLKDNPPGNGFPADVIAQYYNKWYLTNPFDIGTTTRNAVYVSEGAERMWNQAFQNNLSSKANGALMRITPLAVWARNLKRNEFAKTISSDTKLTHPNRSCVDSSIAYCLAISSLINNPNNIELALSNVQNWLSNFGNKEVNKWFDDSIDISDLDCTYHIGFVRYAFTLAFYHLRKNSLYEDGIFHTLMMGGDTDTNSAIVGGMLGALHGKSNIPKYMFDPVLKYKFTGDKGYERPEFLRPNNLEQYISKIYHI